MSSTVSDPFLVPNHHADHPGFAGVSGFVAALGFSVGRAGDADLAVRLTGLSVGDDLVDIGCGPGVAVRRAAAAGAASVVGVDPAPVMLRVARLRPSQRGRRRASVRYLLGSAESLPVAEASASVAWSLATVHHWRELERGLAEARRVLRPGGRFLAIERRIEAGATGLGSHGWTDRQAHTFADQCSDGGFTAVTVELHHTDKRAVFAVLAHRT